MTGDIVIYLFLYLYGNIIITLKRRPRYKRSECLGIWAHPVALLPVLTDDWSSFHLNHRHGPRVSPFGCVTVLHIRQRPFLPPRLPVYMMSGNLYRNLKIDIIRRPIIIKVIYRPRTLTSCRYGAAEWVRGRVDREYYNPWHWNMFSTTHYF